MIQSVFRFADGADEREEMSKRKRKRVEDERMRQTHSQHQQATSTNASRLAVESN